MGRPIVLIAAALLAVLLIVFTQQGDDAGWRTWLREWHQQVEEHSSAFRLPASKANRSSSEVALPFRSVDGTVYFRLNDLKRLHIQVSYQAKEGIITIREGNTVLEMLRSAPVLNRNGIYLPMTERPQVWGNEVWIPSSALRDGLGKTIRFQRNTALISVMDAVPVQSAPMKDPSASFSPDQMVQYLSFLQTPIRGAKVSERESHLPGAPRRYRNGVHEGLDWYGYACGVTIDSRTPVYAVADGIVVRADKDYREMSDAERERLLRIGEQNDGQTPQYILDKMRGRTVWIQHDKGVMSRYAHLSRIADGLYVGQHVKKGQLIGYVGNSGTHSGVEHNGNDLHLHLDLLIYGDWFWKYFTPAERRYILERVFNH
ncbi:M23 family metallopeptidase [Polycladomyces sp. WAk]|uniref:M23 family metallopeptidase n=1 Tax=Polycladomyces zharkentensis TaxID=2807616 RepID=A0ABS2WFV0_9BACL|nr:M23 family metallopeptidase [Polycladomyces sp. WAk]MBN2908425.1 M23 family metallopeptidase [Polycladomyces sp. WAk]